jgi:hypothetical protein
MELPWLLTIAKNVCSTRRRAGMRRGAHESPHDLDSIQDRLATPDRTDVASPAELRSALEAIPERQRRALLLREWRGLSYDEIGSELGLSQSATEALLFRARQSVAERLGAALKALNGLPLFSFVRSLLETGTAKLVAAAVGTTLTIAAVPAAQPRRADVGVPLPTVVKTHVNPHTSPTPRQRSIPRRRTGDGSRPAGVVQHAAGGGATETRVPRVTPSVPPAGSAARAAPPPAPAQTDASAPVPDPPPSITSVTPDTAVDVPLPTLTTTTITTPAVSLPSVSVDVPAVVKVQLP